MLEIKDLTVSYKKDKKEYSVIQNLSFSLPEKSLLAVAGISGCGKTTLLNTLAGIIKPDKGSVTLNGIEITPTNFSIGLIPQSYGLLPWKTVKENCLFCMEKKKNTADLLSLCKRLGIDSLLSSYPCELSGGQAQRTALARAFLREPQILLMDEPFAALDIAAASYARQLTLDLWKEYHSSAMIVTHRLSEAVFLATHIAVMGERGHFFCLKENPWQGIAEPKTSAYYSFVHDLKQYILGGM